MQITDLLVPERVALNVQVTDKAMAIHAMVGMLDRTGCLRDAVEYEKNVLEREAQGTTGVGGGVAIPHGKSNAVLVPALAAVTPAGGGRLPGTGWCPGTAAVFDRSSGWCKRPAYPGVGAAGSAADGTAVL